MAQYKIDSLPKELNKACRKVLNTDCDSSLEVRLTTQVLQRKMKAIDLREKRSWQKAKIRNTGR